ncbi:UNKNOWN [Stylonychia lemnae]|uniref:Transmembrane protein n=1 Tax=Stylonychia lemnae TaxID=5949 RepID=A0A077ZVY3_STYLE|nr:UNKNOWN [Stylonychia lemnae]|eukprot:CDW74110.1 UNKNOWN [Stylonychia lemnae]
MDTEQKELNQLFEDMSLIDDTTFDNIHSDKSPSKSIQAQENNHIREFNLQKVSDFQNDLKQIALKTRQMDQKFTQVDFIEVDTMKQSQNMENITKIQISEENTDNKEQFQTSLNSLNDLTNLTASLQIGQILPHQPINAKKSEITQKIGQAIVGKVIDMSEYTQYQLFICSMADIYLQIYHSGSDETGIQTPLINVYDGQYLFLIQYIVIRNFIIAIRHGYSSYFRFQMMVTKTQSVDFISHDLLLFNWFQLRPQVVEQEIESSLWRNMVEEHEFNFQFFEYIQDENMLNRLVNENYYYELYNKYSAQDYYQKVNKLRLQLQQNLRKIRTFDPINQDYDQFLIHKYNQNSKSDQKSFQQFKAKLVFKEIVLFAEAHSPSQGYRTFVFIALMIRVMIPFLVRQYEQNAGFQQQSWDSYLFQIGETAIIFLICTPNYLFIISGLIDFHRRVLMIEACGALLNPFKPLINIKYQIFPSINMTYKQSIQSWMDLRVQIINIKLSWFFYVCVIFDVVNVFLILLIMLYFGARFNHQFIRDRLQLSKLKQALLFSQINIDNIKNGAIYTGPFLKLITRDIQQALKKFDQDTMKQKIQDVMDEIDVIMQRLEIDGEHQPLKLMGLKATFGLMNTIYTTLITVGFAILQRYFQL